MVPRLIIVEDDANTLALLRDGLITYGFAEPICFTSTERIAERIAACYERPTLLLSDYCVPPVPLGRYLPSLREFGIAMPAVVISGSIRAEQVNELALAYPVRGFFEKTHRYSALIAAISKHLVDLGPEAVDAWENYRLAREAAHEVASLRPQACEAMLRLLGMEDAKPISIETGIGINAVYGLRKDMLEFLGRPVGPQRYRALHEALRRRCRDAAV